VANGWIDQDETWHAGRPRPGHIVLHGHQALPYRRGTAPPPQFSARVCCGQVAGWTKMSLDTDVVLGPRDIVLDGEPAPLPKKGADPSQFSAYFYCGQTARWTKMPLGMKVGLGTGHIVLHGDPAHRGRANNCFTTKLINRCCACQSRCELK